MQKKRAPKRSTKLRVAAATIALGLVANIFSFAFDVQKVNAAGTSVELTPFQLDSAMVLNANGTQTGVGEYPNGSPSVANYIETSCIPFHLQVENDSNQQQDISFAVVYDFEVNNAGVNEIELLEAGVTNDVPPTLFDNLSDFNQSPQALNTLINTGFTAGVRNSASTAQVTVNGPSANGNSRQYSLVVNDVPAKTGNANNPTIVDLHLCARLGINSADSNPGASLSIRVDGDGIGAQNVGIKKSEIIPVQSVSLVVSKTVVNDFVNEVTTPSTWDFTISPSPITGTGSTTFSIPTGNSFTFNNALEGNYIITETADPNFQASVASTANCIAGASSNTANATVPAPTITATTVTCAFTNTAKKPTPDPDPEDPPTNGDAKITVIKDVIDDDNTIDPHLTADAFTLNLFLGGQIVPEKSFQGSETGTVITIPSTLIPGGTIAFHVTESDSKEYNFSTDCSGEISFNSNITCTVTNDDPKPSNEPPPPAQLIVIVVVQTNNGGDAIAEDFEVHIEGANPNANDFPGVENPGFGLFLTPNTAYTVSIPDVLDGYTIVSESTGCSDVNGITAGQTKTCTIVLDDQPATLISVLDQQGYTKRLLTLQTSYPLGTALRRFLVIAELKEE